MVFEHNIELNKQSLHNVILLIQNNWAFIFSEAIVYTRIFTFFSQMKFQRAARTDKGVSAAGQVCSLKISICRDSIESPPLS